MGDAVAAEFRARDERRARETLAIYAGIGIANQSHEMHGAKITADPMMPDDGHPERREYFYEHICMTHGPSGPDGGAFINGTRVRKYRIVLEEVDPW